MSHLISSPLGCSTHNSRGRLLPLLSTSRALRKSVLAELAGMQTRGVSGYDKYSQVERGPGCRGEGSVGYDKYRHSARDVDCVAMGQAASAMGDGLHAGSQAWCLGRSDVSHALPYCCVLSVHECRRLCWFVASYTFARPWVAYFSLVLASFYLPLLESGLLLDIAGVVGSCHKTKMRKGIRSVDAAAFGGSAKGCGTFGHLSISS
jgi:hypothetical protein